MPPNSRQMFIESRGTPIRYGGKTLIMSDRVPARLGDRFRVTIESTRSCWPQGIGMSKGLLVFGQRATRAVVWEYFSVPPEDRHKERLRLPFEFEVECRHRQGWLAFYNMLEFNGRQEWWHGGCAMVSEEITDGRRYFCNHFELDDDFDDLIFSVLSSKSP